ncbi:MAG: hypothetical protein ABSA05_08200 [Opitutaceae bacterium]
MHSSLRLVGVGLAAAAISGCAKKETAAPPQPPAAVQLVPQAERSSHFEAVNRHLELGGTLYAYVDIDGDADKLAGGLQSITSQLGASNPGFAIAAKQDYKALFALLGFNDIKAAGLSSVPDANGGFRNRMFFYTPAGRHGILAVYGGSPGPFVRARIAPADADIYIENEVDLAALYATVKAVAAKVGGQPAAQSLEDRLTEAGFSAGFSIVELINAFRGRDTVIVRIDPEKNITLPGSAVVVPDFSVLVCVDGVGGVLDAALAKSPRFSATTEGGRHLYSLKEALPVPTINPVLAVEGSTFYAASSPEFLQECLSRQSGLDRNPDFQRQLSVLGPDGNGIAYITPRLFARLRQLGELNAKGGQAAGNFFRAMADQIPPAERPIMQVQENLADGILVRASSNRSLKREVMAVAIYNPVTLGLLTAMAVQSFQNTRAIPPPVAPGARQSTLPPDARIRANLILLWAAENRYFSENQTTTATYDDLVGPGRFLPAIRPVGDEDYRSLHFEKGVPLQLTTKEGRVLRYPQQNRQRKSAPPPPSP